METWSFIMVVPFAVSTGLFLFGSLVALLDGRVARHEPGSEIPWLVAGWAGMGVSLVVWLVGFFVITIGNFLS